METKYHICYHTGAGDDVADTLENAMRIADEGASYTQRTITVEDGSGNVLAERHWYGYELTDEDDCKDPICFGSFGFYGDWTIF